MRSEDNPAPRNNGFRVTYRNIYKLLHKTAYFSNHNYLYNGWPSFGIEALHSLLLLCPSIVSTETLLKLFVAMEMGYITDMGWVSFIWSPAAHIQTSWSHDWRADNPG